MKVWLVYKGKRIDELSAERYRDWSEVNNIPRVDEIVRVRQQGKDKIEGKGYEICDLEFKVTSIVYDYKFKAVYVNADRVGIEKTYSETDPVTSIT